jgi:hypothetical protein
MRLVININTDNVSAMEDPKGEALRALTIIMARLEIGSHEEGDNVLCDVNGNKIGTWVFEPGETDGGIWQKTRGRLG